MTFSVVILEDASRLSVCSEVLLFVVFISFSLSFSLVSCMGFSLVLVVVVESQRV